MDELNFVPTQWSTVKDKEKFYKHFFRFLRSGCKRTLFYNWFYRRLSMCFGHIAHFNLEGFYSVWFSNEENQRNFIINCMKHGCYGDPAWTYSDVEKAIVKELNKQYTIKTL